MRWPWESRFRLVRKHRMKSSHVVVGLLCLILGGIVVWFFPKQTGGGGGGSNDSPVTVRGGSIVLRGTQWSCASDTSCQTTLTSPAMLDTLDGVDPAANGNNPQLISEKVSNNWIIVFSFRKSDGTSPDSNKTLKLCTSDAQCLSTSGSAGKTLYLLSDGTGALDLKDDLDRPGARYDLTAPCDIDLKPGHESKCNHIHTMEVFTDPASSTKSVSYHCVDGECTISIG